jgi:hypothetical protein
MPPKPPSRPAPAMGVKDGVRKDLDAANAAAAQGVGYDPNGVGVAWTNKFLNLKPWHPMSFRNRAKVYKAEQQQYKDEVCKEKAKAEFAAEQEYLKTLSMLSAEEQEKYKQRQSVSWLYQKPPGFDAAQAHKTTTTDTEKKDGADDGKDAQGLHSTSAAAAAAAATTGNTKDKRKHGGGNYLSKVVRGVQAVVVQQRQRYELKHQGMGLSPPRGGLDPLAENQRLVVGELDSDEEERAYRVAMMSEEEKKKIEKERKRERRQLARERRERKEAAELQRLQEAKHFLRTAGIQVPDSSSDDDDDSDSREEEEEKSGRKKHRRRRQEKKKRQKI